MIKLKLLLTEHPNDYAWLSPTGTFYPTHDHEEMAKKILMKLPLSAIDRDGIEYIPYELMYKNKFIRVASQLREKILYATNRFYDPNTIQLKELTDLAIENDFNQLYYVKNDAHRLIWDRNNKLE